MINLFAQATDYELLQSLPGITKPGSETVTTFTSYLPGIFNLVIGIAAVLAVVMIIYGGIQYMSTDAFQGKNDAKDTIWNAILGLTLAIAAWVILFTIYPDTEKNPFVNFNLAIDKLAVPGMQRPDLIALKLPASEQIALVGNEQAVVGCAECNRVVVDQDFPSKPAGGGGCDAKLVTWCYIHKDLYVKLANLASDLKNKTILGQQVEIKWQVTEMLPQTAIHASECHKVNMPSSGKCVDASIDPKHKLPNGCTNPPYLNEFLTSIKNRVGNSFQYEVPNQTCYNYYTSRLPALRGYFKLETGVAEHVHINL